MTELATEVLMRGDEIPLASELFIRPVWHADAACRHVDPAEFFHEKGDPYKPEIVALCASCPVAEECKAWIIEHPQQFGMWAGRSATHWRRSGLRRARREQEERRRRLVETPPAPRSKRARSLEEELAAAEIGAIIRERLYKMGRNQTWLGEAVADELDRPAVYKQTTVSSWMTGANRMEPALVFAIERALDLYPGDLSRHLGYLPLSAAG